MTAHRLEPVAKTNSGSALAKLKLATADAMNVVRAFKSIETWLPLALLLVGLVLWQYSLRIMNIGHVADYGLLPLFPVSFYVGLAVIISSFIFALTRSTQRPWILGVHIAALIFVLHGTAPSVFAEPRYPWVYKHFGVVEYIVANGSVNGNIDIYQNWPGFFSGAAWLSQLMDIPVNNWAAWAQVFFNLTYFLELSFIYQALNIPYRIKWLALFLFFSTNWVGQDYFSPQAFSLMLALAIYAVAIAWLRTDYKGPVAFIVRKIVRVKDKTGDTPDGISVRPGWQWITPRPWRDDADSKRTPLLIIFGLFTVMVVSHQLSPYMVILGFVGLTILGGLKPRWIVIAMGAIAVGFLMLHYAYIVKHFGPLFGGTDVLANAKSNGQGNSPSAGVRFVADTTRLLTASMWLLGVAGFIRRLRNGQRDLLVGAMAVAPFLVLGGQNYGGEAIFRVYLFSLPWFSLLAAYAILPRRIKVTRFFVGIRAAGLLVLIVLFLSSYFGLEQVYQVTRVDVDATNYFYDNAPVGAVLFSGDQGLPIRNNGRYALYAEPGAGDVIPSLSTFPEFNNHVLGPNDMPAVDKYVDAYDRSGYFAFSDAAATYAHSYGQMPDGSLQSLEKAFAVDPGWKLWYSNADVRIYQRIK